MLAALRAHAASSCLRASALPCDSLSQLAAAFHTCVGTAAAKSATTSAVKSRSSAAAVTKEPMYCWLTPVLYKPDRGWLYEMLPASAGDKSSAAKASASKRSTKGSTRIVEKQAPAGQLSAPQQKKNWPKPAFTAYNAFQTKMIAEVKRSNPSRTFAEHSKLLGQMWREAPDAVREECQRAAALDELRYAQEVTALEAQLSSSAGAAKQSTPPGGGADGGAASPPTSRRKPRTTAQKPEATKASGKASGKAKLAAVAAPAGPARRLAVKQ